MKISINYNQPKYSNKTIYKTYVDSKLNLIKTLESAQVEIPSNDKEFIFNNETFIMYNPSNYITMILPKSFKYSKLPAYVISTLDKGLNFTPHTNNYPIKNIDQEFENFKYKLLWQNFFSKRPMVGYQTRIPPAKLNNNRIKQNPPPNETISKFSDNLKNIFKQKINSIPKSKPTIDTISFYKTKLFFLSNPQYIVKPADKGKAIVIMHREYYRNMGMDFLQKNITSYKTLNHNPIELYNQKILQILAILNTKKLINKKLHQLIKPNLKIKTPNLYFLPKLHKIPNISGRPICSGNNHPAENVSLYLDYILKPFVTRDPFYLKDGQQLLETLEDMNNIPHYALLFSLDVVNMYPSIPLDELLTTISKVLHAYPNLLKLNKYPSSPETILILLKTVLYTNFSQFNKTYYKQIYGIAMGTPCACTISDIFMCQFVRENLFNWKYKPRLYKQYRDDSFGVWLHGEATLLEYLSYLNTLHPSIKFTLSYGKKIQFLDLNIELTNWGSIETETFYKPTDTFQFLEAYSCHPPAIMKNIPKSQFI